MLFVILGVVIIAAIIVPIFLMTDNEYTQKKCKFCKRSIKIESAKCRYCKKYLLDPDEAS
jgi:hypothetical protein